MNSPDSNFTAPISARRNPEFDAVIAIEIYDGLESGVGVFRDGTGVRITTLGDSQSRLFRAYKLEVLEGDWWQHVNDVAEVRGKIAEVRFIVASELANDLSKFEQLLFSASAKGFYIGIADPYLEWLAAVPASKTELNRAEETGYSYVHEVLKAYAWA